MEHLKLKRYPRRRSEVLQAWDAADELVHTHLTETPELSLEGKRVLVLNDAFGGLSVPLLERKAASIEVYTDSFSSAHAIELNSQGRLKPIHALEALEGNYDVVFARIPKNLSFFEDMLAHLTGHLNAGSQLVVATMVKYQTDHAFDLIEKYIGKTKTSLAKKKARLIFASFEKSATKSPYPIQVTIEGFSKPFLHHSNLFSREKLDIGTRFFLEHLPKEISGTVLDLGCGNGIVGIAAKRRNPKAKLIFTDDSWMALESARANLETQIGGEAEFHFTNCFEKGPEDSVDLALCNPPFHQGTTIGDQISLQMFTDSFRVLKSEGRLRAIGNTHLQYHHTLKRIFGESDTVATNSKFMIVEATKA